LLSTTFHRVYFSDQASPRVENLPENRYKLPLAIRLNWFATRHLLFRSYYRYYMDTWGLNASTFELETSIKFNPFFSLMPFYRFYVQNGVFWFRPYGQHLSDQEFYTSDFDLSRFTAHKFGIGFNWKPVNGIHAFNSKGYGWQGLQMRVGSYVRSDGLNAFYLSSVFFIGR